MLDTRDFMRDRPEMDPLTQLITLLRPRALLWKHRDVIDQRAMRYPANDGAVFFVVARGQCQFQIAGRAPRLLHAGDFLLMIAPPVWTLGSSETAPAADDAAGRAKHRLPTIAAEQAPPKPGVTRLLGGHFVFDSDNSAILRQLLPSIVMLSGDATAARLRRVLGLIEDEALADRPGRTLILERLLEIMLVEAIRHDGGCVTEGSRGLLAALGDPAIAAALRALHADIRKTWTVAKLAACAGMSRSVFAERFDEIVGLSPIDYLRQWRMMLAKEALRAGREPLVEIAEACGYQSVSAFSAAFSRTVGCPPSHYAASRQPSALEPH
jgi:AraC-like DNA-binding protein